MRDRSLYVIVAVLVVGAIALGTGLERAALKDNPWYDRLRIDAHRVGDIVDRVEERTIDAEGAESARVTLEQDIGELRISGSSATSLMHATFDTNPESWLPSVDYSVEGTRGILDVRQADHGSVFDGDGRNIWDVELSDSIPIELVIRRGVGEGTIDLSDVEITSLHAVLGVGETTIDLSRVPDRDLEARIESGIGECTIIVPNGCAVRLIAEKGIGDLSAPGFERVGGEYVNAAFNDRGPVLTVRIAQGIGAIRVESVD